MPAISRDPVPMPSITWWMNASSADAEAAAIPLTAITAWGLLFDRLNLDEGAKDDNRPRPRLLIVGAAGGVGSILIQLAKRLTGARVIGTA